MNVKINFNIFLLITFMFGYVGSFSLHASDKKISSKDSYRGRILEMTGDDTIPVKVWNASGKSVLDPYYAFEKKGLVLVGRDYSLRLDGGRFFSAGAEEYLGDCLSNSTGELTFSVLINPRELKLKSKGCIIGYGPKVGVNNFMLMQEGNEIVFYIGRENKKRLSIMELTKTDSFHLVLTIGDKKIIAYHDGKKIATHTREKNEYNGSKKSRLYFGNTEKGDFPWYGRLARFTLYNKVLSSNEIKKITSDLFKEIREIGTVSVIEFEGTLIARSKYPMPWKEGFTYREVLTVCEYKVNKIIRGKYKDKKIRVAEWAYVDRIFLKNIQREIGHKYQMVIEEFEDNPQLSNLERADTLELDIDAITYYDLSPLVALPKNEYPKPPKKESKK